MRTSRNAVSRGARGLALLCSLALLLGAGPVGPAVALAEGPDAAAAQSAPAAPDQAAPASADEPPAVASPSALLLDADTGRVLFERDADARRFPASTTKVMTALLVLENCSLDEQVSVEASDFDEVTAESSVSGLREGDVLSVRDLLACLLVPSGNDAAYVLARHVAGSWQSFVDMMNERAAQLGCGGTHFANPCGLHDENHYTTARDLSAILRAALAHPEFCEVAGSATWELPATPASPARTLRTTDLLLREGSPVYMGGEVVAAKTGYTDDAGKCLVAAARRDGMTLVGVALGAPNVPDAAGVTPNFRDLRDLFEWGFSAWQTTAVVRAGDEVAQAAVTLSSDGERVAAVAGSDVVATVPRGTTLADLDVSCDWGAPFQAPVEAGQDLGRATLSQGGVVLGEVSLAARDAMALSVPALVLWWLSDPLHALLVAAAVAAVAGAAVAGVVVARRRRSSAPYRVQVVADGRFRPKAHGGNASSLAAHDVRRAHTDRTTPHDSPVSRVISAGGPVSVPSGAPKRGAHGGHARGGSGRGRHAK